jgi:hypothetical protein
MASNAVVAVLDAAVILLAHGVERDAALRAGAAGANHLDNALGSDHAALTDPSQGDAATVARTGSAAKRGPDGAKLLQATAAHLLAAKQRGCPTPACARYRKCWWAGPWTRRPAGSEKTSLHIERVRSMDGNQIVCRISKSETARPED